MKRTCPVPGCSPLKDCQPNMCAQCLQDDAGERLALQIGSEPVQTPDLWKRAVALILEGRKRGQQALDLAV